VVPPDGSRVLDQVDPGVRDLVEQSIAGGVYHQTREGAAAMLCNDMDEATAASTLCTRRARHHPQRHSRLIAPRASSPDPTSSQYFVAIR